MPDASAPAGAAANEPDLIDQGLAAHQRGDLNGAVACYAAAIEANPDDADAHNLLGICKLQANDADAAFVHFERAVALDPQAAEFRYHLGRARQARGDLPGARVDYDAAVHLQPGLEAAWRGLGETSQVLRCFDDAAVAWQQVLTSAPDDARVWNNLGLARLHQQQLDESARCLREALQREPTMVLAWSNLLRQQEAAGDTEAMLETARRLVEADPSRSASHVQQAATYQRADRSEDALRAIARAIELDPQNADAHYAAGVIHTGRGDHVAANGSFKRAAELCPGNPLPDVLRAGSLVACGDPLTAVAELRQLDATYPDRHEIKLHLAEALIRAAMYDEAALVAQRATELRPDSAEALSTLGRVLNTLGRQAESADAFRKALQQEPWPPAAAGNLASMLALRGELAEGLALHCELLSRYPKGMQARSNFLLHLNGDPDTTPEAVYREHLEWAKLHARPQDPPPTHDNDRTPDRPLRIGYVSPDFREHSVSFFFEPILTHHDRQNVTVVCYDNVTRPDGMTAHLRRHADEWRRIVGMSDAAVAELVRKDRIDVLIDLAGHTGEHRLGTFALKPAPVQVTYLGYPNTTGMTQMDYRLIDAITDPPGFADTIHTETLFRLPNRFLNYRPPLDSPEVVRLPALGNGDVTFGSFNALSKYNWKVYDAWAATLRRVENSRLLMKANGLGDPDTQARITAAFAARGVDADRLIFAPRTRTYGDHVATYGRVDIGLDTFPYNGTTTTCEAMWMGVPVLTTAGPSHVARVSMSLMTNVNLPDWVSADDVESFATLAAEKAADLRSLAAVRASMRGRMTASSLMNPPRMCSDLEAAYRTMWQRWCAAH